MIRTKVRERKKVMGNLRENQWLTIDFFFYFESEEIK